MASLGRKVHGAGDTIRYTIEYDQWLLPGESLKPPCTVVLAPGSTVSDVTVSGVAILPSNEVVFVLSGGSANEVFTLNVQATSSRDEVKNNTMEFFINPP